MFLSSANQHFRKQLIVDNGGSYNVITVWMKEADIGMCNWSDLVGNLINFLTPCWISSHLKLCKCAVCWFKLRHTGGPALIMEVLLMILCYSLCVCVRVCVTERALQTDRGLLSEPVAELGQMEYQLLKFFTLLWVYRETHNNTTFTPSNSWVTATHTLLILTGRFINSGHFNQTGRTRGGSVQLKHFLVCILPHSISNHFHQWGSCPPDSTCRTSTAGWHSDQEDYSSPRGQALC